jgi:anti-sigma B factor antagonist
MEINVDKENDGKKITFYIFGRIDTTTAPELQAKVDKYPDAEEMEMDFSRVDFISSAGLRVLLATHKNFILKKGLTISNVQKSVMDVFEVTSFTDVLNIV